MMPLHISTSVTEGEPLNLGTRIYLYRRFLRHLPMNRFEELWGGSYHPTLPDYELIWSERHRIWHEVYEERTLLRPAQCPQTLLVAADDGACLLRGSQG